MAAIAVVAVYAVTRNLTRKPAPFVDARPKPLMATWSGGAWYWIETESPTLSRLVRAEGSGRKEIATSAEILDFAISGKSIAWSSRTGPAYTISVASVDGGSRRDVRQSSTRASGVWVDAERVYWLENAPAAVPEGAPFPPLEAGVRVQAAPLTGGQVSSLATLMEPEGLAVVGKHGQELYVATFRPGALGSTAFFRVPVGGGTATRLAGTVARQSGLLSADGTLYWLGPSPEAAQPQSSSCVYELGTDGKVRALTDWLPGGGRLFDTDRGLVYVDPTYTSNAWPISDGRELPRPFPVTPDYAVLAVGGGEMLIRPYEAPPKAVPLFRIGLP
jgi:hypothetical protein